ncbi:MAG TPA: hypothetical protein VIQ53_22845 [Inquilinus sp.]|uniref:hypothetical protein n=1 Tax=Inquilinus sp. TaxID=1932117 RepID=UPI002FB0C678
MASGDGFLARLASWHSHPGTKMPWWGIPALLLYDALGFLSVGWVVFDLQKAHAGLAMHADIVKIMPAVAIVILSLPALFPVIHLIAVIVNVGRRRPRRRPVFGLKEDQWWRIMAILAAAWLLIAVAAAWMIGAPLHARALASGYIDCDSLFEPANPGGRGGPPPTYVLSADLCLKAGFRRSRTRSRS